MPDAVLPVGVIGHRPNRLPRDPAGHGALHQSVRVILTAARQATGLVAVTSLAEGADRIFAQEALALNCPLICPLPFSQSEFEQDFLPPAALEPQSLDHFRALLERARKGPGLALLEMNGARANAPAAYQAAGLAVLDRSRFLIGIWDGGPAAGQGGTAETLRAALQRHIPVFWLDARGPQNWALLQSEADLAPARPEPAPGLPQCVTRLVQALLAA